MSTLQLAELLELPDPYPLSEGERDELNRRLEAYRRNPRAVSLWPEVKRRIRRAPSGPRLDH